MTFENWFLIVLGTVSTIVGLLVWLSDHKNNKQREKETKETEWSLMRHDYDEWFFERKAPGKVKVYGYTVTSFDGAYESITNKFSNPKIFVRGDSMGIREELQGELQGMRWDLTLYYNDADAIEQVDSGPFPKDADRWVYRLI